MNTAAHSSQPLKPPTAFLKSNYRIDTDIRTYTRNTPLMPLPSKQRTLRLHVPQMVEPLILIDIDHLIIGRASGANHLDLSRHYAKMLGVSREHAIIKFDGKSYTITDLGSTNGTYLNNKKLTAHQPYRLEQADQIRFGHFVAIINY
ncbi:MAG: FHA domain-containing protein [Phototrophicaceae bacterium]